MNKLNKLVTVLVLTSCIMVALGGWVLYMDQAASIERSISKDEAIFGGGNVPQPGFFVSTVALIGFVNLLAISVTSIHLRANRFAVPDKVVKRKQPLRKSYKYENEDSGISIM